ncbi:hypothetical protein F5879DRAFT_1067481 [Lentinula edodes]|nr:hypothetical protein F5879DRAFT_1067481 [Lentinula edodes]
MNIAFVSATALSASDTNQYLYRTVLPDPQPNIEQQKLHEAETLLLLKGLFQLDVNLASLFEEWGSRDKVFSEIKDRSGSIRILRAGSLGESHLSNEGGMGRMERYVSLPDSSNIEGIVPDSSLGSPESSPESVNAAGISGGGTMSRGAAGGLKSRARVDALSWLSSVKD